MAPARRIATKIEPGLVVPPRTVRVPENRLSFCVTSLSTMPAEGVMSQGIRVGQYDWCLLIVPTPARGKGTYNLFLICHKEFRLWEVVVQPRWYVINQDGSRKKYSYSNIDDSDIEVVINHKSRKVLLSSIFERVLYPGVIRDDTMLLEVQIIINDERSTLNRNVEVDMFSPSNLFDVALKMGKEKIYVSKQFLALHSHYFRALFFGDFREANQSVIELKDVDINIFHNVLLMLYRLGGQIKPLDVEAHLEVADRFDFKMMTRDCEEFLLQRLTSIGEENCLYIADRFSLDQLLKASISSFPSNDRIQEIREKPEYAGLSQVTQNKLFDRSIELSRMMMTIN